MRPRSTVISYVARVRLVTSPDGTILAAGLDVFSDEPRVPQKLIDLPNATLLPHVGSASVHTRRAMGDLVVDNLLSWWPQRARPNVLFLTYEGLRAEPAAGVQEPAYRQFRARIPTENGRLFSKCPKDSIKKVENIYV